MPLILRTSADLPDAARYRWWLATTDTPSDGLDPAAKLPGLARRLEEAFEACRDTWWSLARRLAAAPGADLSHTVACGAFGSDFGLMLAWDRLARGLATAPEPVLMVCDDPWTFRQLASRPGVEAGRAPPLLLPALKRRLRGFAARGLLALRLIRAVVATAGLKRNLPPHSSVLLVYGHPGSTAQGFDVYFGTVMAEMPAVRRLLHTDCPPARAHQLAADGRSAALHAWGAPWFALALPLIGWRPRRADLAGEFGWLVRRAAARENGGGGPAMNAWQNHCQRRFLAESRPRVVCWPWENHAWERALCRDARRAGIATVGYQHTVIGPHQINYALAANVDGVAAIPDTVIADGPAYRDEMLAWGVPAERLVIGGAWRFTAVSGNRFDAEGPVFVPLSAIPAIARLQLDGARRIAATGRTVLVKEHPMYPLPFAESGPLRRTEIGITGQERMAAVLYATGTSGLEALLLGVPALRLQAEDRLSIDVLPKGISALAVTLDELPDALDRTGLQPPLPFAAVLAPVDREVWKTLLNGGKEPPYHWGG